MKLGKWGALAGAGQGIMDAARRQEEELRTQRQADRQGAIDEAREKRLLDYKADIDAAAREQEGDIGSRQIGERGAVQGELQAQAGDIESRHIEQRGAIQRDIATDDIVSRENIAREGRTLTREEGAADRQSRERIAAMSGVSAAAIAARERFEFTTAKTIDNSGDFPVETEVQAIRDKETRQTYIQNGAKFVLQGVDASQLGEPTPEDLRALMSGEVSPNSFADYYGFLPVDFMGSLPSQRSK